jgi:hypothetical protein
MLPQVPGQGGIRDQPVHDVSCMHFVTSAARTGVPKDYRMRSVTLFCRSRSPASVRRKPSACPSTANVQKRSVIPDEGEVPGGSACGRWCHSNSPPWSCADVRDDRLSGQRLWTGAWQLADVVRAQVFQQPVRTAAKCGPRASSRTRRASHQAPARTAKRGIPQDPSAAPASPPQRRRHGDGPRPGHRRTV